MCEVDEQTGSKGKRDGATFKSRRGRGRTRTAGSVGGSVGGIHDEDAALHYEFDLPEDGDVRGKAANSRQFTVDSGKAPEKSSRGLRARG